MKINNKKYYARYIFSFIFYESFCLSFFFFLLSRREISGIYSLLSRSAKSSLLTYTHYHLIYYYMYLFIIFLQNLVTKFSSCLDKCPRSMADVISRIYASIILFGHFSYNLIDLTYVN